MGMFDQIAPAADTTELQAGGMGFLESAQAFGAGAVISGLGSIYNTAAAGLSMMGADVDKINTADTLDSIDTNWAKFYKENTNVIDATGFIATSLIPGTLGIKALNLARAGSGAGAIGRALGFAQTQQAANIGIALSEMAVEGGSVFSTINKAKTAAMAWGFADQALQAAAFETAVAATMKQSPMLADDSWWDIGKSALINAAFGGVIGGGIESLILNKSFKNAVTALDQKGVKYSYLQDLKDFNLGAGDKAYGVLDSLLKLPAEVLPEDKLLDLSFHIARPDKIPGWNPLTKRVDLNVEKVLGNTLKGTEKIALQDFEGAVRKLSTDSDVAQPFVEKILGDLSDMRIAGKSTEDIRDSMGDWLFHLDGVSAADRAATKESRDLWYFNKKLDPNNLPTSVEGLTHATVSTTPFAEGAYSRPYVFLGTDEQRQQAFVNAAFIGKDGPNGFPTLAAAWKAGHDVAYLENFEVRVKDSSKLWRRVDDDALGAKRFVNTKTGAFTENTVLTAADQVAPGNNLLVKGNAVILPVRAEGGGIANKIIQMGETVPETADTTYFTARHAWAGKLADEEIPATVQATDFSLMDRLRTANPDTVADTVIMGNNGQAIGTVGNLSLDDVIRGAKLSESQRLFQEAFERGETLDVRAVAYQLNTDAQWLENAVAVRFRESMAGISGDGQKVVDMSKGLSEPLEDYSRRQNLVANFARPQQFTELDTINPAMSWKERRDAIIDSVNKSGGQFVTGELAWSYRVLQSVRANKNAAGSVLGAEDAARLPDLAQDAAKLSDSLGAGASMFGASNANYGDVLKLAMQEAGKQTHIMVQNATNDMMNRLGPITQKLRTDKVASAEVGILTNMLRGTDEKYVFEIAGAGGPIPSAPGGRLMLRELKGVPADKLGDAVAALQAAGRKPYIDIQNPTAAEFLRTHAALNAERVNKRQVLMSAKGLTTNVDAEVLYVPPIDTSYFQHFAFVRPIQGKAFSTSETAMVFGRNAQELQSRIALIDRNNFDVVTKKGTEDYFKAKDAYDFDRTINQPRINTELRRTGALTNQFPEVRAETVAEDYIRWHQNQAGRLIRDAVETNYSQQFAELRKLGETYTEVATSKFAGLNKRSATEVINPYDDYIKTGLDVSKRSEYTFLHQANEFVDALGVRAYQALQSAFGDAKKGLLPWEDVNAIAEKHGIKGLYSSDQEYFQSNVPRDRNLIKLGLNKANAILANGLLRLDFFNSVVNTVSTPILLGTEVASLRSAYRNNPELLGKLEQALSIAVPSAAGPTKEMRIPNTTQLIGQAIKNFFGDDGKTLIARYRANGDIHDVLDEVHGMIDSLAMRADYRTFSKGVDRALDIGAKISMSDHAEQFTRFVSADVMRQLTEDAVKAGTISLKEQNAFISVFTNRVQGNYVSSQRPIAFQGVLGSAVSLFQTYSFNLMQQLFRHIENRDTRAVGTLFGMQAGLFGLNGLPFFEAVNTHLIGNSAINQGHYDAYSVVPGAMGKTMGDWLMYGTASAMPLVMGGNTPALYTRGDVNPRFLTVLPINPMDVPAVNASIKTVQNIFDMGSKVAGGAALVPSLLQGLEHNGLSRPLAGFAQVMAGQSTTSKGSVISASSDFDVVANASRLLGAKPMDEAVALNNLYRMQAYKASDKDRTDQLGERVKTYLYKNQMPPPDVMDGFMKDFAATGKPLENFQGAMQGWMRNANQSVVEQVRGKMQSSYGQRLSEIMGGRPLPDYRNAPVTTGDSGASADPSQEVALQ